MKLCSCPIRIAIRAIFLMAVISLMPTTAKAQGTGQDFLSPIHDIGLLAPPAPPGPSGPKFYSWTGPAPNWRIAQWNIPGTELSPFISTKSSGETVFSSASPEATVKIIKTGYITQVALGQNGTILPCVTAAGIPRESDLLLSPNGDHPNPPGVPGWLMPSADNPPLSRLNSLTFDADISIVEGRTKISKGCKVSQGGALVGIILSDFVDSPPQTMFYQLPLDKLCGVQSAARDRLCHAVPRTPQIFFKTNPYGTSDILPQLGIPLMHSGDSHQISIDVLPRLKLVIETGPAGIDRDLSHWVVGDLYVGQHIWGDVTMQSTWQNIHLLVSEK